MKKAVHITALTMLVAVLATPAGAQELDATYRHSLADFSGTLPYNYVDVHVDREHGETLVASAGVVRVFNAAGMKIYEFDVDASLGSMSDIATLPGGDILLLTFKAQGGGVRLVRCDYRGRYVEDVPVDWTLRDGRRFAPNVLEVRNGRIVLASTSQFLAIEIDVDGTVRRVVDLDGSVPKDDLEDFEASRAEITGFGLGPDGTILYTVAVWFRAIVIDPQGSVRAFGRPGSNAGTFGHAAGITQADDGTVYVADSLRHVIQAWSPDLRLIGEFGSRSERQDGLIRPRGLVTDADNRLYVTQLKQRGVSVFAVNPSHNEK